MKVQIVLPIFVLSTVILFFQNCSPSLFMGTDTNQLSINSDLDSSGGKLYVSFSSSGLCADGLSIAHAIWIKSGRPYLVRGACLGLNPGIPISSADISNPGINSLSYQGFTFEESQMSNTIIPIPPEGGVLALGVTGIPGDTQIVTDNPDGSVDSSGDTGIDGFDPEIIGGESNEMVAEESVSMEAPIDDLPKADQIGTTPIAPSLSERPAAGVYCSGFSLGGHAAASAIAFFLETPLSPSSPSGNLQMILSTWGGHHQIQDLMIVLTPGEEIVTSLNPSASSQSYSHSTPNGGTYSVSFQSSNSFSTTISFGGSDFSEFPTSVPLHCIRIQ